MTVPNAHNPILHKAIAEGNLQTVQYHIKEGEDIDAKNSDGQTALHYAVSVNSFPIVEFLLQMGTKIDEKDKSLIPAESFMPEIRDRYGYRYRDAEK